MTDDGRTTDGRTTDARAMALALLTQSSRAKNINELTVYYIFPQSVLILAFDVLCKQNIHHAGWSRVCVVNLNVGLFLLCESFLCLL